MSRSVMARLCAVGTLSIAAATAAQAQRPACRNERLGANGVYVPMFTMSDENDARLALARDLLHEAVETALMQIAYKPLILRNDERVKRLREQEPRSSLAAGDTLSTPFCAGLEAAGASTVVLGSVQPLTGAGDSLDVSILVAELSAVGTRRDHLRVGTNETSPDRIRALTARVTSFLSQELALGPVALGRCRLRERKLRVRDGESRAVDVLCVDRLGEPTTQRPKLDLVSLDREVATTDGDSVTGVRPGSATIVIGDGQGLADTLTLSVLARVAPLGAFASGVIPGVGQWRTRTGFRGIVYGVPVAIGTGALAWAGRTTKRVETRSATNLLGNTYSDTATVSKQNRNYLLGAALLWGGAALEAALHARSVRRGPPGPRRSRLHALATLLSTDARTTQNGSVLGLGIRIRLR